MITETKFYYQSSINGNFDISKIKLALSDFSEIDDVPRAALGFDVLHVKKVYNNRLSQNMYILQNKTGHFFFVSAENKKIIYGLIT